MHRFHIASSIKKENEMVTLSAEESHHALTVLRLKEGDALELLDGSGGKYRAVVVSAQKGKVAVSVISSGLTMTSRAAQITLGVSVIKPDRMELLIQKACELGVSVIAPLITERCVIRISQERWESKAVRWKKIAQESCKQCGQASIPRILPAMDYHKFIKSIPDYSLTLIPTLSSATMSLYQALSEQPDADPTLILIGPEGDFSPKEVETAMKQGARPVTLGPLVMRSETAAMVALACVSFFYRDIARTVKN